MQVVDKKQIQEEVRKLRKLQLSTETSPKDACNLFSIKRFK